MTLNEFFAAHPKCALGFSGGVDSAYLLYAGVQAGADIRPYYIKTAFQPRFERDDALRLAGELGVSRQIVVGDVALLRAAGAQIDATPRGYQLHPAAKGYTGILACVHRTAEEMRAELYTVVDQGGVVVDVAVENPLYGELRGNLNLASRYDVDLFLRQAADTPECLLSRMTGGVHLHTLHCPDEASFRRVKAALAEKGLLYQKE